MTNTCKNFPLCLPQRPQRERRWVKPAAAASRGAWRRAWPWSIRVEARAWTARRAESRLTAAWTATALRGSKYTRNEHRTLVLIPSHCVWIFSAKRMFSSELWIWWGISVWVLFEKCVCVCVSLIFSGMRLGADSQFSDFLDGLGPGQLVGRQTLATPAMGELQLGIKFICAHLWCQRCWAWFVLDASARSVWWMTSF